MTGRHIIEAHQALTETPRHVEYGWLKLRLPVNCQTIRKQPHIIEAHQALTETPRHVEYGWLKLRLPVNCQTIRKQPQRFSNRATSIWQQIKTHVTRVNQREGCWASKLYFSTSPLRRTQAPTSYRFSNRATSIWQQIKTHVTRVNQREGCWASKLYFSTSPLRRTQAPTSYHSSNHYQSPHHEPHLSRGSYLLAITSTTHRTSQHLTQRSQRAIRNFGGAQRNIHQRGRSSWNWIDQGDPQVKNKAVKPKTQRTHSLEPRPFKRACPK